MSPTFDAAAHFLNQFKKLSDRQQQTFMRAVSKMVADINGGGGFRKSLRVKKYQGAEGVFEMTWAPDGRALFEYGDEIRPGECHIVWLSIGGHDIFGGKG